MRKCAIPFFIKIIFSKQSSIYHLSCSTIQYIAHLLLYLLGVFYYNDTIINESWALFAKVNPFVLDA